MKLISRYYFYVDNIIFDVLPTEEKINEIEKKCHRNYLGFVYSIRGVYLYLFLLVLSVRSPKTEDVLPFAFMSTYLTTDPLICFPVKLSQNRIKILFEMGFFLNEKKHNLKNYETE